MRPAPAKMNPFPGLRPFTQEEDYLFFGREEQTLELLQRLGGHRFVAVVGTSGSGKSSLVRCGLLSELLGGRMLGAGASWEIAVTHPGGNPLALLTDSLLEADLYDRQEEHARENLLATLSRSHFGLVEAVKQADLGDGTNFLLVVDQFEEIFRFHEAGKRQQEVANEFVSLLLEAAAQKEVPIYIVLTMRSDFIGECGQFEGLAEMVNRGEFLIPRLTRDQYKRVIEGPIKVAGGQLAPRLLQRLLNDLGQQADQLPCLQHALMRTWDVWAGKGDTEGLDLDDYQHVGKMSQALSLHADEIYHSLASDRQRQLCQGIFQSLTVEESNSRGIRRPQRLGRLCQILEVQADELLPIIDAYRQSGVTFLMPSPEVELTDQTIIDISHESLMRVWTRLRQWVEEETQAAGIYHRLSECADLHEQGKAGLYRDPELGIALAWRESKRPNAAWAERYRPGFVTAMAFLEASQQASVAEEQAREAARQRELQQAQQLAEAQQLRLEQQQRSARKLRKLIAVLAVVAVLAASAGGAALVARNEASKLAQIAEQEADNARKNAQRAEQSQQETIKALAVVESQKAEVEGSLSKAEAAERLARAAEKSGRKLLYTTDMRLAPFMWRDDRTTAEQLRVLLAKHIPDRQAAGKKGARDVEKPDLRGFEWHYYQHLLESSATVFAGHSATVAASAFHSNDQLVTLDQNGQVRRWNLDTQSQDEASRRDLPGGPSAQVRALSPNSRLVALAEWETVHVYDSATGKETYRLNSPNVKDRRLIFSRDGSRFVLVDDKIRWCNAVNGEVIASVAQRFARGLSLALSADGLTLAVVGHGPTGGLFSIFRLDATTKKVTSLAKDAGSPVTLNASALTAEGGLIAVGAKLTGAVSVYDTTTGRRIAVHPSAHASPVSAMAFAGSGAKLVTADTEGTIKIWADAPKLTAKSAAMVTLKGHQGVITTVGFSIEGKRLLTTSGDKTARVWDLDNAGAAIRPLERMTPGVSFGARYSPDGQLIAVASFGGTKVRLWDAATGRLVQELSGGDKGRIYSVAFSPTDNRLLAVGYGGQADVSYVALWDIATGTELARFPGATDLPDFPMGPETGVVGALAFSPDGKYLVAGFGAKYHFNPVGFATPLKVWEVATRRPIRRLMGHTGYCVSLDFSRDGTYLATGSRDGTVILWSTATWKAEKTLQNPDKDSLTPTGRPGTVEAVAFSPDGNTLALASREETVQLWDVAGGKLLATLKGHSSAVSAIAFAPDGRTLASGGMDQTVRLWNVETRQELMQLDSGSVDLDHIETLAFSPDGQQLLAGGRNTLFWSTAPVVWNDPDRAAENLRRLLQSNADFQSRIRMLSENLRLYAALEKLDSKDVRVSAALAAAQANWHASRQAWPEAVAAYDRLVAADPASPAAWLRTPGLLRLATALLHQDRPRDAASLLTGGAKRRALDGLTLALDRVALGVVHSTADGAVRLLEVFPGSPASRSGLLPGDVILKVNDTELTGESLTKFASLATGEPGSKFRLTVRRSGSDRPEVMELTRERFILDGTTGKLLHPLRTAVNERLARDPRHPGLLELRAELAGQWSDTQAQLADYTTAIEALSQHEAMSADLKRLYGRRGNANVSLGKWQEAVDDFAHVVTKETTDEELLANQARAHAGVLLLAQKQFEAMKIADPWGQLATAFRLGGDQKAIDDLVARRPQAAGSIGDLFAADNDWSRAVEIYSRGITAETTDVVLLSKRARAQEGLKNWDAAAADWSRAATGNSDRTKLLAEFARRLAVEGQIPFAKTQFEKAQALYERSLEADPDNDVVATELAQLLLNKSETRWTVLKPVEMKSENGSKLEPRNDGTIIVSQPAKNDNLTLVFQTELKGIKSLRLEALADSRLPRGGPGWAPDGNFVLNELSLQSAPATRPDQLKSIAFRNAVADISQLGWDVRGAVDGNLTTGWAILPEIHKDHTAVFETVEDVGDGQATRLTLRLAHQYIGDKYLMGRFRVSVSDDPAACQREQKRFAVLKATEPWLKLAVAYAVNGRNDEALQYFSKALRGANSYEARKLILETAARFDEILALLVQRNPDDSQLQLTLARRLAERGKQRLAEKQPAEALPDLQKAREIFTRLRAEPNWTVLKPVEIQTENGSKLEPQKDDSIFVPQPANTDTYSLVFQTELKGIKYLRLEALADSRLPRGGPGWSTNDGNFVLSELSLLAAPATRPDQPKSIALRNAAADYSQPGWDVRAAIDGNLSTGWAVSPEFHKDHTAIFETVEEVGDGQATRLTVRLNHQHREKFLLGRFRLSVANDPGTLQATRIRLDLKESEVVDLNVALAKAHAQLSHANEAVAAFIEALDLTRDRAAKVRIITEAAPLEGVLEQLAERAASNGQFQVELARHFAERGNAPLANAARTKARTLLEQQLAGDPDNAVLAAELAELVLEGRLVAVLQGETPKDNAERLTLARRAYNSQRYAGAAKLWGDAVEADPKLLSDRVAPHLYNAACGAALAARGAGKDIPKPDDAARDKLRKQSLGWLKAELNVWSKLLESGSPEHRTAIVRALSHWQRDTDLVGIRDAAALAKLPAEEQKAFTQLWADVATLLKKAEEKTK